MITLYSSAVGNILALNQQSVKTCHFQISSAIIANTRCCPSNTFLVNILNEVHTHQCPVASLYHTGCVSCYQMYIRPICEYAAVIWSPHLQTNIHQIEMIQRKAARLIFNDYSRHSSVTAMLTALDWKSLEKRRDDSTELCFIKLSISM